MERTARTSLLLQLFLLVLVLSHASAQGPVSKGGRLQLQEKGVFFTENRGQVVDLDGKPRPEIRYVSRTKGMALYLAGSRISYVFSRIDGDLAHHRHSDGILDGKHPEPIRQLYRIDLEFIGANAAPDIIAEQPGASYSNYYLPHLPDGLVHVPSFGRITYRNIYPKIDFVLRGSDGGLKYDFIVHPGGRLSDIRMRYVGATGSRIDDDGKLVTTTPLGGLIEDAPYTFQEQPAPDDLHPPVRRSIASHYRIVDGVISFATASYDPRQLLVIDPTQQWSTYFGGDGLEDLNGGDATEVDRSGNCLFAAYSDDGSFPTSPGAFSRSFLGGLDVVVVKMSGRGRRIWSTFYGGFNSEMAHGIVSDKDRNIFIAGHTESSNFPVLNAHDPSRDGNRDAFAVKFDSAGIRKWATYYGGNEFDDSYGFAIDSSGNPAMIGTTTSTESIATPGSFQRNYNSGNSTSKHDCFLVKFNGNGVRQWGTYVGGSELEYGYGAATDIHDNINITGWTNSSNFPVTAGTFQNVHGGEYDAFVMRFNSNGSRIWGTFFGGPGRENQHPTLLGFSAIATDGDGNPIITGITTGQMPVSANAIQPLFGGRIDAYVAKFDASGRRLWSTYYGGSEEDMAQGIASNSSNGVLITGYTFSVVFPGITPDAFQRTIGGTGVNSDAFIVKLNSTGTEREYVTFYGGAGTDEGVGISFDPFGSIVVGGTCQDDFPVTADAEQRTYGGGDADAFIALFCDMEGSVVTVEGPTTFCPGEQVTLSVPVGYSSYLWQSRTNPAISTANEISVSDSGEYWVRLTNGAGCSAYTDTIRVALHPTPVADVVPAGTAGLCPDDSLLLTAEGGFLRYQWRRDGVDLQERRSDTLHVHEAGSYTVMVTDANGCVGESMPVQVQVVPGAAIPTITGVEDDMTSSPAVTYQWNLDSLPIPGATGREHTAETEGWYTVTITDANGCRATSLPYFPLSIPTATVGILEYSGVPGERVTIPLTLRNSSKLLRHDVSSFSARIRFDRKLLQPVGTFLTSSIAGDDGVITIAGNLPANFDGSSISLAPVDFRVMLADVTSTPLVVEIFEWNKPTVVTTTFNGRFTLTGLCESGGIRLVDATGTPTLKPARPNPAADVVSIEYEIVEDGPTELLLVDMRGGRIPIVDATLDAGRYMATFDVSQLPSGRYVCILQTRTQQITESVTIRK